VDIPGTAALVVVENPHDHNVECILFVTDPSCWTKKDSVRSPMPRQPILKTLADLIYPPTCVLCGAAGSGGLDLCSGCRADLPLIGPCCARCAVPLPVAVPAGTLCGDCQQHPPSYRTCHAVFRYQGPLPALVGGLKFRDRFNLIRLLGTLMAEGLDAPGVQPPDLLVPVPLHAKRLRERGYNQALALARVMARAWGTTPTLVVDARCCRRRWPTKPQMTLDRSERLRNLRGAFQATADLGGRRVAIVDDVVTTGGTVSELARVLYGAGCRWVDVWALARTP
jgi:ComF family protein